MQDTVNVDHLKEQVRLYQKTMTMLDEEFCKCVGDGKDASPRLKRDIAECKKRLDKAQRALTASRSPRDLEDENARLRKLEAENHRLQDRVRKLEAANQQEVFNNRELSYKVQRLEKEVKELKSVPSASTQDVFAECNSLRDMQNVAKTEAGKRFKCTCPRGVGGRSNLQYSSCKKHY